MINALLEKNLQLFSKRFEHLHKGLQTLVSQYTLPEGIELFTAKNNEKSATFEKAYLHSAYNPSGEAKKLMQSKDIQNADSIVFFGAGLGYEQIECASLYEKKTIIIIEPNPYYILLSFSTLNWAKVFQHPSLIFLIEAPQQTVITILEQYGLKECFFVERKAIMQHESNYFATIQSLISRNIDKQAINMRTLERFSTLWLSNMCKNLPNLEKLDGIVRYKNKAKNIPAFVLAAGPTLDEVLPFLHEVKKRCILICVDTALRACLAAGVEPHFIVLVDPQYWNARHIDGLQTKESILITESAAYPSVFRFKCREIILCSSLFPLGKYVEKFTGIKGELAAGGSVATSAWDFARFIGCEKIYMAGLDLSFPNKKTHAKGSTFEEKAHSDSSKKHTAETALARVLYNPQTEYSKSYNGKQTITDARMKLYAWWFESKCSANPGVQTYTLSPKSLHIPLIKPTEPKSILQLQECVDAISTFINQKGEKNNTFASGSILQNLYNEFSILSKIVDKGISLCKKNYKTDKEYEFALSQLTEIDNEIFLSKAKDIVSLVFPNPDTLQSIIKKELPIEPLPPPQGTYIMAAQYNIHKTQILYSLIKKSIDLHTHYLRKNA